ncbi:MAG: hypothetical protein DRO05_04430 [Thermoproteota archaeon]|nr:MAG: hypothetical protein DRO05_04430 [Candidatus Korarchaeota archaeon]
MKAKLPIGLAPPKRYVIIEVKGDLDAYKLVGLATKAIQDLYGVLGACELRLALRYSKGKRAIVETTNRDLPKILTALAFGLFKSGLDAQLRIVGVHGTIKKCFKNI